MNNVSETIRWYLYPERPQKKAAYLYNLIVDDEKSLVEVNWYNSDQDTWYGGEHGDLDDVKIEPTAWAEMPKGIRHDTEEVWTK